MLRQAEEIPLPAQSCQRTLKRVARVSEPSFGVCGGQCRGIHVSSRTSGIQGWVIPRMATAGGCYRHGIAWPFAVVGVGHIRIRGNARTAGEPKTCDITYRHEKWYASIVLACRLERTGGTEPVAFDWGIETFATIATEDSVPQHIENPRLLTCNAERLRDAYRARDTKHQFSRGWRLANTCVVQLQSKIARQRLNFHHKESAKMVGTACAVFTETLHVAHMTQRPTPRRTPPRAVSAQWSSGEGGIEQGYSGWGASTLLSMVRYKAAEAGIVYTEAPTRHLKPSQRLSHVLDGPQKAA